MDDILVNVVSNIEISMRQSRLADIQLFMVEGANARAAKIAQGIEELSEGAYLFGTGPYTVGIYRLSTEEVVIGRYCSAAETPGQTIVDMEVKDSICFGPREASRNHACIKRIKSEADLSYFLKDLGSTCGTYLNGRKIEPIEDNGIDITAIQENILHNGDIISIGAHHINSFVFIVKN